MPTTLTTKAVLRERPVTPDISVGDIVYLHSDRNKSCGRNRYLVVSTEDNWCNVQKFIGSQLRNTSYRVKHSECYKVPSEVQSHTPRRETTVVTVPLDSELDDLPTPPTPTPVPELPHIAIEISTPPEEHIPPEDRITDSYTYKRVDNPQDKRRQALPMIPKALDGRLVRATLLGILMIMLPHHSCLPSFVEEEHPRNEH